MPGGSTKKTCPFCQSILFCAQKICAHCLKEQPKSSALRRSSRGWTQDSTGQGVAEDPDEERVTLNLKPCDPSEPTNNWQEAGTTRARCRRQAPCSVPPKRWGRRQGPQRARCRRQALCSVPPKRWAGGRDRREPGAGDKHRAGGGAEGPPLEAVYHQRVGQEAGTTKSQVPETSTVQVEVLKTPPREAVHHHREGMLHRSNIYASGRVVYQLVVLQYLLVKALLSSASFLRNAHSFTSEIHVDTMSSETQCSSVLSSSRLAVSSRSLLLGTTGQVAVDLLHLFPGGHPCSLLVLPTPFNLMVKGCWNCCAKRLHTTILNSIV
ncbi:hypothetical protein F7725_009678 [Dissostichus mawsoni]|uniref:Uncharacterized protein n=1 Tax=Dissostichus mawsoni TaxID=36200 RepID=A0A7J5XLN5_DISMA|nr:hypothetical protein F7725_009678 [Dissostichus mawsoni]